MAWPDLKRPKRDIKPQSVASEHFREPVGLERNQKIEEHRHENGAEEDE
jgi:hypothetical protein